MDPMPDIRPCVVPRLAGALDEAGRLILPPPRPASGMEIVSPGRARELAAAFVRSSARSWLELWEARSGREIDLSPLVPGPFAWFADTPHLPPPPRFARERVCAGPWYVLHLESGGEPRVMLEVSAYATGLVIDGGLLADPAAAHEYLIGRAVTSPALLLVSPEQAVAQVSGATGAKVTEIPTLVRRNGGWVATASLWRLVLDRAVEVETVARPGNSSCGVRSAETVLFVGPGGALLRPASDQGPVARMPVLTPGVGGRCVDLPLRPGMAQRYDEVRLV